jgi:hypothetical protein
MRAPDPRQAEMFVEAIEHIETKDVPFIDRDGAFGARIVAPAGGGWRVLDASRERSTKWVRRRSIARPFAPALRHQGRP